MNHWRCGRPEDAHADWCSDGTPNDCTHCGGNPCRWWCLGENDPYREATREVRALAYAGHSSGPR
jgi:hypothetical protein